jgi:ubiquinone/menaquinone biosynthesis C-methylase UbiE
MPSHRDTVVDQFTRQAVPFATAEPIRDAAALQLLVDTADTTADDEVLDVACGPGLVACAFSRVARRVVGLDLTPAMLEEARALAARDAVGNVEFRQGDVCPLPFDDGAFSLVVSRFAFHHFPDPDAVLAEMRRVCRPGGRVVVADFLASADPVKAAAFHRMEVLRDPSHARALTRAELGALFARAGLPVVREATWRMDVEVEALLARSFPAPGDEDAIRRMFEAAAHDDGFGLDVRRRGDRILFTYTNAILVGARS